VPAVSATALVAGVVMAGSLFAAAPAVASPASFDQCPANRFCAWTSLNGTFTTGVAQLPLGIDNNIESGWNRTSTPWCLYDLRDFRNLLLAVAPGEQLNLPGPARNRVSSLRPCP
jgi:hypothetical protein